MSDRRDLSAVKNMKNVPENRELALRCVRDRRAGMSIKAISDKHNVPYTSCRQYILWGGKDPAPPSMGMTTFGRLLSKRMRELGIPMDTMESTIRGCASNNKCRADRRYDFERAVDRKIEECLEDGDRLTAIKLIHARNRSHQAADDWRNADISWMFAIRNPAD